MSLQEQTLIKRQESILSTNRVLRNTYLLLSLTLLFSTLTAAWSMVSGPNLINTSPILFIVIYFGLFFLTTRLKNSVWGIASVFALTGFLGYTLGPILDFYIKNFSNGSQLVMTAMGATGAIFLSLSMYVLVSRKDFSYLGGFLFAGIMIAFIGAIMTLFFQIPMLYLLVSCAFALLASGLILFETSLIVRGGETNYIMATITLYVAIFNLFISLLQIFGAFGGNRN